MASTVNADLVCFMRARELLFASVAIHCTVVQSKRGGEEAKRGDAAVRAMERLDGAGGIQGIQPPMIPTDSESDV